VDVSRRKGHPIPLFEAKEVKMESKRPWRTCLTRVTVGMTVATFSAAAFLSVFATGASAADLQPVQLAKPNSENVAIKLLEKRSSSREFSSQPLPVDVLSNLLWAAWGVNRSDGHRTAPSANNRQDIEVYALLPDGAYLYDAKAHMLKPVAAGDFRAQAGTQPFVKDAPLNLVYVSDYAKLGGLTDEMRAFYSGAHTGFIAENVYLYCASEGLATVVRAMVDKAALAKVLKLRGDQHVTLSQTVGYPKKR
jgi:SagB-type dehydrogenase family enzyme